MKTIMRNGKGIRRGVSLLLMVSLLIALLPAVSVAETTVGAYGSVTVTSKNVVIRSSPAGSRTGYFAQKGTYPMIGPVETEGGVDWYNIQTSETAGFVSSAYATASYGSAGMPSTEKNYVYLQANLTAYLGPATVGYDHTDPFNLEPVVAADTPVLQLETGVVYTVSGVEYINLYYDGQFCHVYYDNAIANGLITQDNLNDYIFDVTWPNYVGSPTRQNGAEGDFLTHAIQAALNVLGYYDDAIDGSFGALTEDAVRTFQTNNGLAVDGIVGTAVYTELFSQAINEVEIRRANYGLGGDPGTQTVNMIQTTVNKLRIRKSYTTSSIYVGTIEVAGTILTYTRTQVSGTVTWYYIQYQGTYGWVMGTYVTPYSTSTTTPPTPITNYGTVTITKKLTAIRKAPNGARTGYSVNTGDVCTMIGPAVEAGGYTWYYIRTESGRTGYVRGDCATPDFGSAGMPSTDKKYVQFLYTGMQIRKGNNPATPIGTWTDIAQDSVQQLTTGTHYTVSGVEYINLYVGNEEYHALYNNALVDGLMSQDNTNNYIANVVWARAFGTEIAGRPTTPAVANTYTKDILVHAVQAALYQLGLYDDKMDGTFGDKTASGVIKFKHNNGFTPENEYVDSTISIELFTRAKAALQAKLLAAPDTGDGTVPSAGVFGTVNTVKRGSWSEINGSARPLFPKGSVVTVMSVATKQVFRLYRWSGANHADVVPYDTSDTATLCSILGVTYNSSKPDSSDLSHIIASGSQDYPDYTWPKFRWAGTLYASDIKIPVWVNLNGTVYCASLYVMPHGYDGTSGFSRSKLGDQYYYDRNNMYGMMCLHFYGSKTHSSNQEDPTHRTNIQTAYNTAKTYSLFAGKVQ